MKFFYIILITSILFGQNQMFKEKNLSFVKAMAMEKNNDIDNAIQIYKSILNDDPFNQPSYFQLKNIYNKKSDYESAISLTNNWLKNNPNDLQSELSLGEMYFQNQQKDTALKIWKEFGENKLSNKTTYRLLFHTYARFGQVNEMELLVKEGRSRFKEPHFFAIDLANYYQSRQTFDRSLNEYLILIFNQKQLLSYVTDRILVMSDDTSNHLLIDSTLNAAANIDSSIRSILSSFYYKTGQFNKAFYEHKIIGINNQEDASRWLIFANNLRKENQNNLSIEAYHYFLENQKVPNPNNLGKALLGLGKAYENQIDQTKNALQFVKWFPQNYFFQNQFIRPFNIGNESLANTLEHYESILALMPSSYATGIVHYRLGKIQARVLQDYIGANKSFESALKSNPNKNLINKINIQIGEMLLLSGSFQEAEKYYKPLTNQNINENIIQYLKSILFQKDISRSISFLDSIIVELNPEHRFFNDLLELQNLLVSNYLDGTKDDQLAFKLFFNAEALIYQNKTYEAISNLEKIISQHPDALITPLSTLRLAILLTELNEFDKAHKIALSIQNSDLKDQSLILAGEINEKFRGDNKNAIKFYNRILSECPNSLLLEPIRVHIRKLSKGLET